MKVEKKYVWIVLFILIGIFFLKYNGLFVISQDDLTNTGVKTEVVINSGESYERFTNFSIVNNSIKFKIGTTDKSYSSPATFFMMDDSNIIYNSFQDITDGTHTVKQYQMNIFNNQIQLTKYEKTYNVLVNTIYINRTIANQTIYVNVPGVNQTIYVNQTQTVTKQVLVQPTLTDLFNQYKIYVLAIVGIGLIYYLTRRKK